MATAAHQVTPKEASAKLPVHFIANLGIDTRFARQKILGGGGKVDEAALPMTMAISEVVLAMPRSA